MYIKFKKNSFLIFVLSIGLCCGNVFANGTDKDSTSADSLSTQKGTSNESIFLSTFKKKQKSVMTERSDGKIVDPISGSLIQNFLSGLATGGYYRGYFISRKLTQPYGTMGANKVMSVGDGYYDPMLFLYVGGNPTPTTSFGSELILLNPFTAYQGAGRNKNIHGAYTNGEVTPFFTMVLRGGISTKAGPFNVVAGGIEWLRLTPFTFGSNVGFNRFSLFERRPWDPAGNVKNRYASYYYSGNINQDTRWGSQAFKGFTVNGFLTKLNTNIDVFYGKTAPNGGVNRENIVRPSSNLGVRVKKNLKNSNYVSLNTFNSFSRSDSVNSSNDVQWNIFTTESSWNIKGVIVAGELGYGRYMSPNYKEDWSEAFLVDVLIPKKFTYVPINLRYFQIGNSFTSNVANFNNTSVQEVNSGFNGIGGNLIAPFGGSLDGVGDIANNRRGAALNTNIKVWKFVFTAGTQISAELEKLPQSTSLTFSHRINGLVWSRLPGYFPVPGTFGPNNRVGTFYRGAYERVNISELNTDGTPIYKRHFNSLDFQVKFKERFLNKDFYINYLGTFNSAQNEFSAITKFDNSAYVRAQFHEVDLYYHLTKDFMLAFYAGLERIQGNEFTDLSVDGKPRDQTGQALGIGFDFSISSQTTLFFRQRWFSFEDKNFVGEKFNGNEATVELKIFF